MPSLTRYALSALKTAPERTPTFTPQQESFDAFVSSLLCDESTHSFCWITWFLKTDRPMFGLCSKPPPVAIRLSVRETSAYAIDLLIQPGSEVQVGRGIGMQLADAFGRLGVSRRHASVGVDLDLDVWIRDDCSRFGTQVNSDRIGTGKKTQIRLGDIVALGQLALEVTSIGLGTRP